MKNKICMVSSVIGNYDQLLQQEFFDEGIDYCIHTDSNDYHLSGIKVIKVKKDYENSVLEARKRKILTHRFHPAYDIHVWIDGSFHQTKSIMHLIGLIKDYDMIIMKHPDRNCPYKEAQACINMGKDNPITIEGQMKKYREEGFTTFSGNLPATGFIIKKNNKKIQKFMRDWYKEVEGHSIRDQLSFNYAYAKNQDVKIGYIPFFDTLSNFAVTKHLK